MKAFFEADFHRTLAYTPASVARDPVVIATERRTNAAGHCAALMSPCEVLHSRLAGRLAAWRAAIGLLSRHHVAAGTKTSVHASREPSSSSSSSSLSHFYEGSIWDDSRLHAARSFTSSPDGPFSLRSSFTQSAHLFFGFLSFCFLALLYSSPSFLRTHHLFSSHAHRILCSWTFIEISPTFVLPLIFSFLILSNLVTSIVTISFLRPPSSYVARTHELIKFIKVISSPIQLCPL